MNKQKEIQPTFTVPFGDYTASLVDGIWIYKADSSLPLKKEKVNAKPKYKDPVQYKVMEEYEGAAENFYKSQLMEMVKEIAVFLKEV